MTFTATHMQDYHNRVTIDSDTIIYAKTTPEITAKRFKRGIYKIIEGVLHKRCSRCKPDGADGEYFPADSEFFYATKSKTDGLSDWCKACYQEWRYPNGRASKHDPKPRKEPVVINEDDDDEEI